MNVVRSFVNYAIIRELCDRMRFEVDSAKSHHRVISEGLDLKNPILTVNTHYITLQERRRTYFLINWLMYFAEITKVFTEFSLGIGFEHACGLYFKNQIDPFLKFE